MSGEILQSIPRTSSNGSFVDCSSVGCGLSWCCEWLADARARQEDVKRLEARVNEAMDQPEGTSVAFVELHDALTTLRYHKKPLPGKFDEQLLEDIEKVQAAMICLFMSRCELVSTRLGC